MKSPRLPHSQPSVFTLGFFLSLVVLLCAVVETPAQSTDYVGTMTNTPGLLGYWRFDSPFLTNSWVNGYTGTNEDDSVIGSPGSGCPLVSDSTNAGLVLDGNAYLATDLVGQISNQYTLMAWINIGSYPGDPNDGYYEIIDQQEVGDDCDLIVFPDGTIHFYTDAGGNVSTPNPVPVNEWHFIVGTMTNGGPRRIYIDGEMVGENTAGTHIAGTNAVWIGYGPVFAPRHFLGSIDEAAIFSRALTPAEVAALFLASGPTNIGALQSLSLSLPPRIAPGDQAQASVSAVFSGGSRFDITPQSTYSSSDTNVLTVNSSGVVTARRSGTATVTARYGGLEANQEVSVPPQSTDYVGTVTNTPGLLGYWRFDAPFPTNSSVNGYSGTNEGGAAISLPGGGCPLASNPTNQSLVLNGNGYLATDLVGQMSNQFTLMAWVNISSYPGGTNDGYYEIIDQQQFADDCDLIVFPDGRVHFFTDAGGADEVSTPNPVPLNEWHFIVGTMTNGGPRRVYLDGQLVGENTAGTHVAGTNALSIGYGPVFTPRHFVGAIDEAAVFNRALAPSEVAAIYLASGVTNVGTLQSLSLNLPSRIAPGATAQAAVAARFSGGTSFDVTSQSTFSSSDTNVLTIDASGLVLTYKLGMATVTASYGGLISTQEVSVAALVPPEPGDYVGTVTYLPGLVGYWRFDAPYVTESWVNGYTGTKEGDAAISAAGGGCPIAVDPTNQALVLSGTGYLATDLVGQLGSQYTLMAWINIGTYPGNGTDQYYEIIDQQGFGDDCDMIVFPDGTIHFYTDTGGNVATPNPVPLNEWHFIVGTMTSAGPRRIYVDGQLVGENVAGTHSLNPSPLYIGYGPVFTPRHFVGSIDEAAAYDRALTPAEVAAIYVASGPPNLGTLQSISVSFPPRIAPGVSAQSSVRAQFSGGSSFDVTFFSTLVSSDTNILSIDPTGLVTTHQLGTATLTGTYRGLNSTQSVVVTSETGIPVLADRYSFFNGTALDSIGGKNGTLIGTASLLAGSGLVLDGTAGCALSIPSGTIDSNYYALSIEMWATIQQTPNGTENVISTFGNSANQVQLGTHDTAGAGDAWIGSSVNGIQSVGSQPGPISGTVHLVGVWNLLTGAMEFYENGWPLNGNVNAPFYGSINEANDATNIIGADLDGNSGIIGTIQEYRIYRGALTLDQIRTSLAAGPTNAPITSSNTISAGSLNNLAVSLQTNFIVGTFQDPVVTASSATVQNINLTAVPGVTFVSTDTNVLRVTGSNQVQAVGMGTATLTATFSGASGQVTVTTLAAPTLLLTHEYSFVNDANDSIAGENGVLMGFATAANGLTLGANSGLSSYGDFLWLPRDLIDGYPSLTLETWVSLSTLDFGCRLFSAGSWSYGTGEDQSGILLSPHFFGSTLAMDNNPGGNFGGYVEDLLQVPADVTNSTVLIQNAGMVQLVAVWDGPGRVEHLYYNGVPVGSLAANNTLLQNDYEKVFLGKSLHVNDPFVIGTVNECRLFYGVMAPGQVAADYAAGSSSVGINSGAAKITDQPVPQTAFSGQSASFTVGAVGQPPLSYQWFLGGVPIPGATNGTYTIANVSGASAGVYTVQVSNSLSGGNPVLSQGALLTVTSPGGVTIARQGPGFVLSWTTGVLQSANSVLGPWSNVSNAAPPSFLFTPTPGDTKPMFFRVQFN